MPGKLATRHPLRQVKHTLRTLSEKHMERHRPTGREFAFADRVDYLNAAAWDQVTQGGSLFLRREVLRVLEQHGPDNVAPRYAMIYREETPVAAVAAQVVAITGQQFHRENGSEPLPPRSRNLLKRALTPAAKIAAARINERLLVTGNLMSWGFNGIALAPQENPEALWPAIAEALYRIRRAERLAGQTNFVMVKDVPDTTGGLEAIRRFSYRPLETEPNMVLSLNPHWRNYDDYLSALDAKYRRNARDQLKKLTAAGCVIESLTDLKPHTRRLHELYMAVHQNACVRLVTLPETYLPSLATTLGDQFRCNIVRRGEEILGFVTSLRDGPTAIAYYIGFDRAAAAAGLPIYLRLLHSTIGDAMAWGCTRLSLGRTALEPKAALGAKPETLNVWLRHRVPVFNWLLRGVMGSVTHDEAPERNPFKLAVEGSVPPAGV